MERKASWRTAKWEGRENPHMIYRKHTQFKHPSQQLILAPPSQITTVGTSGYLFSKENSKASRDYKEKKEWQTYTLGHLLQDLSRPGNRRK